MAHGGLRTRIYAVKIWDEPLGTAPLSVRRRGSIERIEPPEIRYFESFEALLDVLTEHLGGPMNPPAEKRED